MEHDVVWNGTIGRARGQLLCGEWDQRRDNSWTLLLAPDQERYPNLRAINPHRGHGLRNRICPYCRLEYHPRRRKQKYCSSACSRRGPKSPAFTAHINTGQGGDMSGLDLITCYICGTTHGFGSRCPSPTERAEAPARLRRENGRLRAVLQGQVLPHLRGMPPRDREAVIAEIEDALRGKE